VSIVANYIKERTKNAQFIIISLSECGAGGRGVPATVGEALSCKLPALQPSSPLSFYCPSPPHTPFPSTSLPGNNMFELADRLVGIYKTHDVTKSVAINPKTIAAACGLMQAEDTMSLMGGGSSGTEKRTVSAAAPAAAAFAAEGGAGL
jgi:hypothetical protein